MNTAKSPEISVVIPLYNKEKFVSEAIKSVLDQSYRNLEVLVVDDKSTDRSLEVARSFESDERVKVIANSQNRGPAYSQNKGIRESKGAVIGLLGADDVYHPDKLKIQMERMCEAGRVEDKVVYTDYFSLDEDNRVSKTNHLSLDRIHSGRILNEILKRGGLLATASAIFLREAALEVGLFDESLRIREDFDFILKLAGSRDFVGIPLPLYGYRIHTNSLIYTTPKMESYSTKLKIMEKHLRMNPQVLRGQDGREIKRQIARCLIISRNYKSALLYALKDPSMVEAFYFCMSNK